MKKIILIITCLIFLLGTNTMAQGKIRKSPVIKVELGHGFTSLMAQGYFPFNEVDTTRYVSKEAYSEFPDPMDFCQTMIDPNGSVYLWDNLPSMIFGITKKKGELYLFGPIYEGKRIVHIYNWTGECIQPMFEIEGIPYGSKIKKITSISEKRIVLEISFAFHKRQRVVAKPFEQNIWKVVRIK